MSRASLSSARAMVLATVLTLAVAVGATACSGQNPYQAAASATTTVPATTPSSGLADNPYLPNRNVSDCVGTLERPDCGSSKKGGTGMYLTFAALILGLGFVMWRISIGVRARDAVVNAEDTEATDTADDPAESSKS
jgi:hypothetical protein